MATRVDLIASRSNLERLLEDHNPNQKELEMSIYDLLLFSRINYVSSEEKELDYLIQAGPPSFDELGRLDAKSRFLSWKEKYGHGPAYIIGLNFDPETDHFAHRLDGDEDPLYSGKRFDDDDIKPVLFELGYKDGAILIKRDGTIYAVRVILTNVDAKKIYESGLQIDFNNAQTYGFRERVTTRHYSALGASFHLKGLITYTLSEESGNIRRYANGKITFSTLREENPVLRV